MSEWTLLELGKAYNYEAKVWHESDGWTAKVLRNDSYFDSRALFDTREEALKWARETAEQDRATVIAEAQAERVEL